MQNYLSEFEDHKTAKTDYICALQRAKNLSDLGRKDVIELCVGPSLQTLEKAYRLFGINVTGNDIDPRWMRMYPNGNWIIGDCREVNLDMFDCVVYAPPLSKGCSGKREDSLSIDEVFPPYSSFLSRSILTVLVLPGRTLSTREDRSQLHKLLKQINRPYELVAIRNKVVKYWDLYLL